MNASESGETVKRKGLGSDLRLRVLSSLVLIPLALAITWWGGVPAYTLCAVVGAIVLAEWAYVTGYTEKLSQRPLPLMLGTVAVVVASLFAGVSSPASGLLLLLVGLIVSAALARSAWLALGIFYAGLFGAALSAIRADPLYGLKATIVLLVLVWATDSVAYVAGRALGGPKLWPRVSPKKTWSGSLGGLLGGTVLAALVALAMGIPVGFALVAFLFVLSIASQIGDLAESALKRKFGKKDASAIIPGHGGMMDRVDGLIFAAALALLVGWLHGGVAAVGQGMLFW